MNVKKTIAALSIVAPLTFVAACGNGEGAEETTVSTVTSTSSTTPTTTVTSEETEEPEATEEETEEPSEEVPEVDPLLEGMFEEPEPVAGGALASEADRAEIEQLVRGIYEVETFHQFLRYIPENSCHRIVEEQGGAGALDLGGIPDEPLRNMPTYTAASPYIDSVTDVRVDGNEASAVVTAVSAGQAETRTQRYLREDGRWKFCN